MIIRSLRGVGVASLLFASAIACAQVAVPSNGSSGAFQPTGATYEVDLSLARTGQWDETNVGPNGVYDPAKWAVVFHYSSVNIPAGTTVTFKNHPKNPPVVWLVQGDVVINGSVNLNGRSTSNGIGLGALAVPGPGGFRGGAGYLPGGSPASAGFGPGGGQNPANVANNAAGSFGSRGSGTLSGPIYNNPQLIPLIGGSGGAGQTNASADGGAGGGAILVASQTAINLTGGAIRANGGSAWSNSSAGSGGGIRLIANQITGTLAGALQAIGGSNYEGGVGRIRIEANTFQFPGTINPANSSGLAGQIAKIWPEAGSPSVRVVSVGGISVPVDPESSFVNADVQLGSTAPVEVIIETQNVPLNWNVQVRRAARSGTDGFVNATYVSGPVQQAIWRAEMSFSTGGHAVIARAYRP